MKKNIIPILIMFVAFSTNGRATDIPKPEYRKLFKKAEKYFVDENYPAALAIYMRLDSADGGNANLKFKIGFCYLNSSTYKIKSIPYFEKASKDIAKKYKAGSMREKQAPMSTFYYLAKAYQLNYEFDKAISLYRKYKSKFGKDKKKKYLAEKGEATFEITTCNNGKELMKKPVNVEIKNLGAGVNSEYPEYSPVVSLDEKTLIFTSRREGGTTNDKLPTGQYYEDIYTSTCDDDGNWGKAVPIGKNINTKGHEASVNLTTDGQKLLIYKDDNGDGNLYESELQGTEWETPKYEIEPVNSMYWETHACYTPDNRILYFVSDRPGGFGGRDIYKSLKLPNGKWGPPQNLGDTINTKYDEDGVFIAPDGKQIFFASKGHNSMGGFDIFTSMIDDENGFWSAPINFGYPVNTPDDNVFLITSPDGRRAYFSSDREGGFGEKDIYVVSLPDKEPRDMSLVVGMVVNNSKEDISNNKIAIINTKKGDTIQVINANAATGKFGANLPIGGTYKMVYTVNNKQIFSENLSAPKGKGYQVHRPLVPYNGTNPVNTAKIVEHKDSTGLTEVVEEEMEIDSSLSIAPPNDIEKDATDRTVASKVKENEKENLKNPADKTLKPINKDKEKPVAEKTSKTKVTEKENQAKTAKANSKEKENILAAAPSVAVECNPEKSNYQLFFRYNKKDINAKARDYKTFIDAICGCLKANSNYIIHIESSASHVPTKTYKTNENLAKVRAESAKNKMQAELIRKGFNETQLVFDDPKELVQGPEYNKDAKKNRKVYERYQYIKIYANEKK